MSSNLHTNTKIVVAEFIDSSALDLFSSNAQLVYDPKLVDDRSSLLEQVKNADALIVRNRTQVDKELIEHAELLKVVGRLGVGLDNIDVDLCASRNIKVCPATGANTQSVAEYVITTTMLLLRGAYDANKDIIKGDWPRNRLIGKETADKCLGLWGYGAIARAVAQRAKALGMTVVAYDPFIKADDPAWQEVGYCQTPEELLKQTDVLSLHLPLTDSTRNIINQQTIQTMREGAIIINTSRGGIVDEQALANSLASGKLGGAALDVFAQEPLTMENAKHFVGIANLVLTPHIAGVTNESNVRVSRLTVQNVMAALTQ